jgi:hypothetical protein
MGNPLLIVPVPVPDRSVVGAESAAPRDFELTWLAATGEPIGAPLRVSAPRPIHVEYFGAPAGPAWRQSRPDSTIPAVMPEGTQALRIGGNGVETQEVSLAALSQSDPRPPDAILAMGDPAAAWRLAVVGDGYDTQEAFARDFELLWQECQEARPFNQLAQDGDFGLVGLFWASPDRQSLFGARRRDSNPWIIYGSQEAVVAAVRSADVPHNKVLVVMNRDERGGAGGFGSEIPSWTTNVSAVNERWTQIALHELGHAFGLADEYVTAGNGTPPPDPLEPNVSSEADPRSVSWHRSVTITDGKVPSLHFGEASPFESDAIGTFQGARYDPATYYRPAAECRMLWVNRQFCPICTAHIAAAVKGGA